MFSWGKKESFDAIKLKANLKMAVTRIRMQQNKRVNNVKRNRKELADLVSIGKLDSARIRVEATLREDLSIEGLELLVLFTELVTSRLQVILDSRTCPTDLKEAITSMIWASARVGEDIQEFRVVRDQFILKYSREFVEMAVGNTELSVNQKVLDKLNIAVPSNDVCVEYMKAVCDEFGVELDESQLQGPQAIVTVAPSIMVGAEDQAAALAAGGVKTKSGFVIPPLTVPRDDLEMRLMLMKRE